MEKQISREEIYNGKVIHVVKDEVELDDGTRSIREVVLHNGGACIALKNEGKYYMVSQYRYSLGKEMLEFPAGKIEKGEDPDETILREAVEETGYSVKNIKKLGSIIPTCGYCSERIHLYYGEADEKIGQLFLAQTHLLAPCPDLFSEYAHVYYLFLRVTARQQIPPSHGETEDGSKK